MLNFPEIFNIVEQELKKNGTIEKFEKENGKITGRMMITSTDIPENMEIDSNNESIWAFECSFDFYDVSVCLVIDMKNYKIFEPICFFEQIEGAEPPDNSWIEFFFDTLLSNISDDGSFGIPICTFLNDYSDFTVVPTI